MPELNAEMGAGGQDSLLTAEDVAAFLRVTPAWVYGETRRNRIPHIRLGRFVRFRRDALAAWMQQMEDQPAQAIRRRRR